MCFDRHTKIAFLDMGLMGSRMATRLLQAGFEVAVWNRTRSACDALIDLGATLCRRLNRSELQGSRQCFVALSLSPPNQ